MTVPFALSFSLLGDRTDVAALLAQPGGLFATPPSLMAHLARAGRRSGCGSRGVPRRAAAET